MEKRVVVTGLGAVSPLGNDVKTTWENMKKGVNGIDTVTKFDASGYKCTFAGEVRGFDPTLYMPKGDVRKTDLYCQYAVAAATQAYEDSGMTAESVAPERFGVYIGSGIGGLQTFVNETKKLLEEGVHRISPLFIPMMISNIAAGNVAIKFKAQGVCLPVVTACSTGTHSAGEAYRAIKYGYADAIITGGSEASVHPLAIGGFANSKALSRSEDPKKASIPFNIHRNGFVMAEGAGVLVFESLENAQKRGAKIYAEVCGYGNTCDAYHYTAPHPEGIPASRAMKQALSEAGFDPEKDTLYINAHGTSTPLNDKTETAAIKLALGDETAHKAIISSTKSMTGHMLGATGAVELIASTLALVNGIVPPTIGLTDPDPECDLDYTPNTARKADLTIAMSNTLGFGGHNATVALRKW